MGTEQVLRVARLSLALALAVSVAAASAVAGPDDRAEQASPARVILIDLTPESAAELGSRLRARQALAAELGRGGVEVVPADAGDALGRALAGEHPGDDAAERALAALERVDAAQGADCTAALRAAHEAVLALAALQARSLAVRDHLVRAYAHTLRCAHEGGDADTAMLATRRLERLGVHDAPPGISEALWRSYPVVDATTNAHIVELRIDTEPTGGVVWLDHVEVGAAPVTVFVTEGEHVVAAAHASGGSAARVVVAAGMILDYIIAMPRPHARHGGVARRVAAWRASPKSVTAGALGELMAGHDVRFALVLAAGEVAIWALGPGEQVAQRIDTGEARPGADLASRILARARRWDTTGPEPGVELLRETELPRQRRSSSRQSWWVYATVAGAVALASGLILAQDLAPSRQRIELTWP